MEWNKLLEGEAVSPHDIVMQMREVEQYWLGQAQESFDEGAFTIMPFFIRLVDTIINLEKVTRMIDHDLDGQRCITIYFDAENYERFFESSSDPSYSQLRSFIEAQKMLTSE